MCLAAENSPAKASDSSPGTTDSKDPVRDSPAEKNDTIEPANGVKKVFVAGATGSTGRKIVQKLLEKGIKVKAGVRNFEKAKSIFSESTPNLEFVSISLPQTKEITSLPLIPQPPPGLRQRRRRFRQAGVRNRR